MSLAGVVRNAVAVIDKVVKPLEEAVTHRQWTGQASGFGGDTFDSVTLRALVDQHVTLHKMPDGRVVPIKAHLTILEVITPNGASARVEPIDPKDRFTLADGTSGPVVDVRGFHDAETGRPYLVEVWMG